MKETHGRFLSDKEFAMVLAVFVIFLAWQIAAFYYGQFIDLGDSYYVRGNAEEALSFYGTALRLEPWSSSARLGIAQSMRSLGRIEEALPVLNRALFLAPHDQRLLLELGFCRSGLGDWPGAAEAFGRAARISSDETALAQKMLEVASQHAAEGGESADDAGQEE